MAVPNYQSLMLPLLKFAADGSIHTLAQAVDTIADQLKLSEQDRNEMLQSGQQTLFNRIGWSKTYMAKALLLEAAGRGKFKITARGLAALRTNPDRINVEFLNRYPEFVAFRTAGTATTNAAPNAVETSAAVSQQTPQELLEISYQTLHRQVAQELLEKISSASPRFFEKLVVDLLVAMGYGGSRRDAGQAIGKSGDDGIDGIIKEDRLGLDAVYIQAKRWKATVGRPEVQSFAGSLEGHRARKGVFITTSQFSSEAKDYVNRIEKKIILIDGEQLANLSIEFGIGVAPVINYKIQRIDLDYFEEE
jgi:restriction system protein